EPQEEPAAAHADERHGVEIGQDQAGLARVSERRDQGGRQGREHYCRHMWESHTGTFSKQTGTCRCDLTGSPRVSSGWPPATHRGRFITLFGSDRVPSASWAVEGGWPAATRPATGLRAAPLRAPACQRPDASAPALASHSTQLSLR